MLASCNYPLESKKRFCGRHKLDGMVILNKPKCAFPGGDCNVRPSFNYPGENKKPQFCFSHCLQGMEVISISITLAVLTIIILDIQILIVVYCCSDNFDWH